MACNCNYLLFFVWLLIVKTDKHLLPWWVRNYYSLNTIVSCLVNRKIIEFYITKKKGRGTRDQIANIWRIMEKVESSRKTSTSALLTMPKPLTVWIITNCGKLKRWEYQSTLSASWEICMQIKKQQLELGMEQQTGSKSGKKNIKAV